MYEFWYDYVKPKYGEKAKLCYVNRNSFIVYIKTEDVFAEIPKDFEIRFNTLNYELERPLHIVKKSYWINKRWIRWKNNERNCGIETKNI